MSTALGHVDVALQLLPVVPALPRASHGSHHSTTMVHRRPLVGGRYDLLPFIEVEPLQRFQYAAGKPGSYGPYDLAFLQQRRRRNGL